MSKSNFVFHYVIGRGGFGKVRIFYYLIMITEIGVESRKEKDWVTVRNEGNV